MNSNILKYLIAVCLNLIMIISPISVSAMNMQEWRDQSYTRVVRYGVVSIDNTVQKLENGTYLGETIEYLLELSKYAGWKIEFVEASVNDLLRMLKDGEIDLIGNTLKNSDTMELFDFPSYSSGSLYAALISLKSNKNIYPMQYSSFEGMKVGIFNKALNRIEDYELFKNSNGLNLQEVYFDSNEDLSDALYAGEVDAILSNDRTCKEDEQIIARFTTAPYYFAVKKGNTGLLRELNLSMGVLREVNSQFEKNIQEKYAPTMEKKIAFTEQEQEFIKTLEPLKVAVVEGLSPIERYEKNKIAEGITPDVLRLIAEKTGLEFEFVPAATITEAKNMLLEGAVDLVTGLCDDKYRDNNLVYTQSFLSTQLVMLRNAAPRVEGRDVAAKLEGYIVTETGGVKNITYDSVEKCIYAVVAGRADHALINSLMVNQYARLSGNEMVSLTAMPNINGELMFAMARPAHPVLVTVMDKAIHNISLEEIQTIVFKRTVAEAPATSLELMFYEQPTIVVGVLIFFGVIAIAISVLFFMLSKSRLRLANEINIREEGYRIVNELAGEQIFLYDFATQRMSLPENFAQMLGIDSVWDIDEKTIDVESPIEKLLSILKNSEKGDAVPVEFCCTLENGQQEWFQAIGTILLDKNGKKLKGIGGIRNIQKEMHNRQNLEKEARTDYLTKMYNRQYGERCIHEAFSEDGGAGALLVIDIDFFKKINDSLGHTAGDEVLKEFASILSSEFSKEDITSRWGGDEFMVFVRHIRDENLITAQADKLCRLMNREYCYEGQSVMLSISIGIAMANQAGSYQELFQKADAALYEVKNYRRNGFQIG